MAPVQDWTINIGAKQNASSALAGMAKSLLAIGAAYIGIQKASAFVKESIAASAAQEKQERRLWAALQQTGQATQANFDALNKSASAMQRLTTFEDDAALAAQTMAIRLGSTVSEATAFTKTAADLATVLGGTLEQRVVMLSRAAAGNIVQFERMGIYLDKTKIAAGGAAYIVGELNKKFGGAAAAEVDTYAGRMVQLANNWGDFKEVVGDSIVKSEGISGVLKVLNTIVLDLQDAFKSNADTIGVLFATALKTALDTVNLAVKGLGAVTTLLGWQFNEETDSLAKLSYALDHYDELLENSVSFGKKSIETTDKQTGAIDRQTGATKKLLEEERKRRKEEYDFNKFLEDTTNKTYKEAIERNFAMAEADQKRIDDLGNYYTTQHELAENNSKRILAATKKLNDGLKRIDAERLAEAQKNVAAMMPYIEGAGAIINDVFYEIGAGTEEIFKKMSMAVLNFARQALQAAAMRAWAEAILATAMSWFNPAAAAAAPGLFAAAAVLSAAAAGMSLIGGVASRGGEAAPTREARTTEGGRSTGYASGSSYVPETGLALVHRGETVVPAGYRDREYPGRESRSEGVTNWFVSALDARSFRDAIMREVDAALRQRAMLPDGRTARALRR